MTNNSEILSFSIGKEELEQIEKLCNEKKNRSSIVRTLIKRGLNNASADNRIEKEMLKVSDILNNTSLKLGKIERSISNVQQNITNNILNSQNLKNKSESMQNFYKSLSKEIPKLSSSIETIVRQVVIEKKRKGFSSMVITFLSTAIFLGFVLWLFLKTNPLFFENTFSF